jgi:hypothetical protein
MNTTEAGMLLRCHRIGREPDGRVQKAVRVAEGDTELGKRLREQLEFDAQIVEAIHYIIPPEDLREKLGTLSDASGRGRRGLRSQMSNPAMLAALAGVLLFIAVVIFLVLENMKDFEGREAVKQMLDATTKMNGTEFEAVTTTTTQLGDWFYMRGYEGYDVPPELATLPVIGSRVFRQDGKPVAQFVVERHDSVVFEFHAADFGVQLPADGDWQVLEQGGWAAAVRQHGDHCFMIAFRGVEADMRTFLQSLPKK